LGVRSPVALRVLVGVAARPGDVLPVRPGSAAAGAAVTGQFHPSQPALILTFAPGEAEFAAEFATVVWGGGLLDGLGYNGVLLVPRSITEDHDV
jgi:hypothetical protein